MTNMFCLSPWQASRLNALEATVHELRAQLQGLQGGGSAGCTAADAGGSAGAGAVAGGGSAGAGAGDVDVVAGSMNLPRKNHSEKQFLLRSHQSDHHWTQRWFDNMAMAEAAIASRF